MNRANVRKYLDALALAIFTTGSFIAATALVAWIVTDDNAITDWGMYGIGLVGVGILLEGLAAAISE